jgi:hypothetical protein
VAPACVGHRHCGRQRRRLVRRAAAGPDDLTDFGQQVLRGPQALAAAEWALGELSPVGHHVTNVVLTEAADDAVQALSKGIGINADGTCGSVTYEDGGAITAARHSLAAVAAWRLSLRAVVLGAGCRAAGWRGSSRRRGRCGRGVIRRESRPGRR